jgi:hypothetical protein
MGKVDHLASPLMNYQRIQTGAINQHGELNKLNAMLNPREKLGHLYSHSAILRKQA